MSDLRQQCLTVEVAEGRLIVSIGVEALVVAAAGGDDWDEERYRVADPDAFAAAVATELEAEEGDGTTPVHIAFDTAILAVVEGGDESVEISPAGDDDHD